MILKYGKQKVFSKNMGVYFLISVLVGSHASFFGSNYFSGIVLTDRDVDMLSHGVKIGSKKLDLVNKALDIPLNQ